MIDWIDSDSALQQMCQQLSQVPKLAVDTEFIRTDTFYPKIALIQISDGEQCWLIDVLAIEDFVPLKALLENPDQQLIFHACAEDLEVLEYALDIRPSSIFDTQLAAGIANIGYCMGYARLVDTMFDVSLDKQETRSDWLARPLTQRQLDYAAVDVQYLHAMEKILAKALAEVLFGSERALIRFDMSEFQEPHSISKLIGAPPGYVGYEQGGRLTEAVRRQPFSVVLLDEIEKAHPDIYNTFLQVLDEGRLTDGMGRTVDFRRVILIMTSNTGYNVGPAIGFTSKEVDTESPLKALFTPEFLDRLDEVIRFRPLTEEELVRVAEMMLEDIRKELQARDVQVSFAPELARFLVDQAPKTGSARALRSVLRERIEDPLAVALLRKPTGRIHVSVEGGQVAFHEVEGEELLV